MSTPLKIAVTGAAGQIGYAFLFRLASGQIFGNHVPLELRLLEVEAALPSLEGVAMELDDCAFPLLRSVKVTSDPKQAFAGVNWAVLIGAAPRKAGMERSDLLGKNGGIFTVQGDALNGAADDVRVFVVGNPCNTNCLIAMQHARDIPKDRFYAMTMLDQNRAVSQLAIKSNVLLSDVKRMVVWGNHSSTQFPDFYNATIKGKPVVEVIEEPWLKETFIPMIQQRGAAVIKARGASSAASAANGIVDSLHHLVTDTPAGEVFSISRYSQGEYGIDEGLIFSVPCRTVGGKLIVDESFKHGAYAQEKIKLTLEELRQERDMVKELKLIG